MAWSWPAGPLEGALRGDRGVNVKGPRVDCKTPGPAGFVGPMIRRLSGRCVVRTVLYGSSTRPWPSQLG